ncbi:MAG: CDP-alcohol phosphatidyltransferase family protein [Chlamydiae bacterium]|nr:CDP-alcohol phosphatidyltransferase family protein [Chlamydiota bacterium]
MKRFNLIPNVITAFGLSCGLFVIYKVFLDDVGDNLFFFIQSGAIILFVAALADVADGAVARLLKNESEFGGQFDSLSDAVTFGVAPPLLVLRSLYSPAMSASMQMFLTIAAMIFTLCGVLRLVRYNISAQQACKKELVQHKKVYFKGLPIPAAAALIVSTALVMLSPLFESHIGWGHQVRAWVMVAVMLFTGYFMLSPLPFPGLKSLQMRVPSFFLVFAFGIFAVLLLWGLLDHFAVAGFFLTWGYFLYSLSVACIRNKGLD